MIKTSEEKPWKGICVKSCWYARGKRCKCRCWRKNHGRGLQRKLGEEKTEEAKEYSNEPLKLTEAVVALIEKMRMRMET